MFQSQDELHKYLKKNNIITTTLLKGGFIFSPNRNFGTLPTPKKTEYFILHPRSDLTIRSKCFNPQYNYQKAWKAKLTLTVSTLVDCVSNCAWIRIHSWKTWVLDVGIILGYRGTRCGGWSKGEKTANSKTWGTISWRRSSFFIALGRSVACSVSVYSIKQKLAILYQFFMICIALCSTHPDPVVPDVETHGSFLNVTTLNNENAGR